MFDSFNLILIVIYLLLQLLFLHVLLLILLLLNSSVAILVMFKIYLALLSFVLIQDLSPYLSYVQDVGYLIQDLYMQQQASVHLD